MRKQPVWMETPKTVNSEKGWVQREEREIKKEKRVGRHIVKGSGEGRESGVREEMRRRGKIRWVYMPVKERE